MSRRQSIKACFAYWAKQGRKEKALWARGMWTVRGGIAAKCNRCGFDYEIFCEPEDFDQNYSYCGGSERCLP